MDSATIVAFEERAVQAEARLAAIEARLAAGVFLLMFLFVGVFSDGTAVTGLL